MTVLKKLGKFYLVSIGVVIMTLLFFAVFFRGLLEVVS